MNKKAVTILMFLLLLITVILPLQKIFASEQPQKIEQVNLRVAVEYLYLIHISEPTIPLYISYAVFSLKKKNIP